MNNQNSIISIAPGRVCLFGDHQDYLGLPIIACAINRFIKIEAITNNSESFHIDLPDLQEQLLIDYKNLSSNSDFSTHFITGLIVLKRHGCIPNKGYNLKISGTIPINAGLSSSSAVMVAWINFLIEAYGINSKVTPELVAKLAYEAEVVETNSSGGKMDQYSISIGDIIYLETDKQSYLERLYANNMVIIIGESGVPKATLMVLKELKEKVFSAIKILNEKVIDFDLKTTTISSIPDLVKLLPDQLQPFFIAAIKNHDITKKALAELKRQHTSIESLGALMNAHHKILKDQLNLTVPKIDKMIEAANDAGALGSKIVGSGKGGSIVAICRPGMEDKIINSLVNAGAKNAYQATVSKGAKIIK